MATPIPENQVEFSLGELAEITGGVLNIERDLHLCGVVSDSRSVREGNLFVALEGETFDGHDFVERAVRSGARALLVEKELPTPRDVAVCRVPSTLEALGALANRYRRRHDCRVIAVAGSAGKTTTKATIAAGLETLAPGQVHATAGNLNNLIGVPFVLFGLSPAHRFAVIEIGTNRPGEVQRLTRMVEPDLGVLTLIGIEHSEGLGDLDAIEAEEGALPSGLPERGTLVYNADDVRVRRQAEAARVTTKLGYGRAQHANYRLLERVPLALSGSELRVLGPDGRELRLTTPLIGEAGALATLAAFSTAQALAATPLDPEQFAKSLAREHVVAEGRLSVIELLDGSVLVDDSYNANPASMRSSLSVASEIAASERRRLILVLGEMRELGALATSEHQRLGAELAPDALGLVVAIGGEARHLADAARARGIRAEFVESSREALGLLLEAVEPRDVILVKASRGVRAEHLVRGLVEAKGRLR